MNNLTPLWLLSSFRTCLRVTSPSCTTLVPSNTITCGEASSHLAVGEAFRIIARGDADVCICGGAESKTNPMAAARSLLCGRLNVASNDACTWPADRLPPTCGNRKTAEGGGLLILESLNHAINRRSRIYAEVVGFGAATSVTSWSMPDPSGEAYLAGLS